MIAASHMQIIPARDLELTQLLDRRPLVEHPAICWLGQAGFLLYWQDVLLLIDPYLSDSLAAKYRGTLFPHARMMPPPVEPARLTHVDAVLCTHAHTDHKDPETLSAIAAGNLDCRFMIPRATIETALSRGIPASRLLPVNVGQRELIAPHTIVQVIASAHEELQVDESGSHRYVGYVIRLAGLTLYHSGDCIAYPDLVPSLAPFKIDVALLPVNGRDDFRRQHGVPGNFTFAEATALCREAGIPTMVPCHFGMFDFNTVDPLWLDQQIADAPQPPLSVRLIPGHVYWLAQQSSIRQPAAAISQRNPS